MKVSDEDSKFLMDAMLTLRSSDKELGNALRTSGEFANKLIELYDKYGVDELFSHIKYLEVKQWA